MTPASVDCTTSQTYSSIASWWSANSPPKTSATEASWAAQIAQYGQHLNTSIRSVRSGTAFHGRNFNRFFRILSPRRHATIALCQLRSQGSEKRRFPSNFYEELMYVQFEIKKNFLIYYFQKFNLLLFSAVWWTFTIQFYVKAGEERQARSHGGIRGQFPQIFCTSPNFIFPRKICLNIQ